MSSRRGKRRGGQPNEISSRYALRTIAMLDSPAYWAVTLSGQRALSRLQIEYRRNNNGNLIRTFEQFQPYGIAHECIAPAIRELIALGFIEITERDHGGNVACTRTPTKYRLTTRRTTGKRVVTDVVEIGR
jgi:hypothetical protein